METSFYASEDGEMYKVGPCATREEAIQEAIKYELGYDDSKAIATLSFDVIEADQVDVELSNYAERVKDNLFETILDDNYSEANDTILDSISREDENYLVELLKRTFHTWEHDRGIVIPDNTLYNIRNQVYYSYIEDGNGGYTEIVD